MLSINAFASAKMISANASFLIQACFSDAKVSNCFRKEKLFAVFFKKMKR